jgi:hypothetical protein
MKLKQNKFITTLLIISIGAVSSFYIFQIASEKDELKLIEYFDKIIIIFAIVLALMAISSFLTKK